MANKIVVWDSVGKYLVSRATVPDPANCTQFEEVKSTSDATPTAIATIPIELGTVKSVEYVVNARRTDAAGRACFNQIVGVYRAAGAPSIISPGVQPLYATTEETWSVAPVVVGNNLEIQVTGEAAKDIDWQVNGCITESAFVDLITTDGTKTMIGNFGVEQNSVLAIESTVVARKTDDADREIFRKLIFVQRETGAASIVSPGEQTIYPSAHATWAVDLELLGNNVRVNVTGAAATQIEWAHYLSVYELKTDVIDGVTSDATPISIESIGIPQSTVKSVEAIVLARRTDSADRMMFKKIIQVWREAGSAAITAPGEQTLYTAGTSYSNALALSGNNLENQVTGVAASDVNWRSALTTRTIS